MSLVWQLLQLRLLGSSAEAACDAQKPPAASARAEKDRCLLQHSAGRLVPRNDPVNADSQALHNHHTALGLIESRLDRVAAHTAVGNLNAPHGGHGGHGGAEIPAVEETAPAPEQLAGETQQLKPTAKLDAVPKYSLLMEVHIPTRLRDLHIGTYGPLPKLVSGVQQQLQEAAAVPSNRLRVLDVRGEYMTLSMQQLDLLAVNDSHVTALLEHSPEPPAASSPMSSAAGVASEAEAYDCQAGYDNWQIGWSQTKKEWCCKYQQLACPKETIVDIEILPGASSSDPSPSSIMTTWARQVAEPGSSLRQGPLAPLFETVTLVTRGSPAPPAEANSPVVTEVAPEDKSSARTWATSLQSRIVVVLILMLSASNRREDI